jgi:hypothetical protein
MWQQIAPNSHFNTLLYNEPAKTLIAHFQRKVADNHWVNELYTRQVDASGYAKIAAENDLLSFDHPITAAAVPMLYFNAIQWGKDGGGDWDSVRCIDLRSGQVTTVVSPITVATPAGYVGLWISALIAVDPDGQRLICNTGFERVVDERSKHVDYWVCSLSVQNKMPQQIALLSDAFF